MKVKTALKQSKQHATFLGVVLAGLLVLLAFFPGQGGLVCVGLVAICLAVEVINIVYIIRKSRTNSNYLEEKIK